MPNPLLTVPQTAEQAEEWVGEAVTIFGLGFHGETEGHDYVDRDRYRVFSDEDADRFNEALGAAWTFLDVNESAIRILEARNAL